MSIRLFLTKAAPLAAFVVGLCTITLPVFGDEAPAINYPRVVGFSPGHPFLFRIPASGDDPLEFTASGLPTGLTLDHATGLIFGVQTSAGSSDVKITVTNKLGSAASDLKLICGANKLVQTPPMGWSPDNVFGAAVNDTEIRDAADHLVSTGLAEHGYQYIFLGDSWEGKRTADGKLVSNNRFPDMKALIDYIHSKGLKFGIYSAATSETPSGFAGSLGYEQEDAGTFASWGVDYLTYDWAPNQSETNLDQKKPYADMGKALAGTDRDIVYALRVLKRMSEPDQVGDQVFEARNGLYDDISLIAQDALYQANVDADFGPGHWISHGPLFIGRYGYPDLHLSRLTSGEQMTQMSLWSLFSAPLVVSCDLNHLDPNLFNHATSSILMNDEVLAVDQDPDAKPPVVISNGYGRSVWMKPLSDGRTAVAFVNTTNGPNWGEVKWADINLSGTQPIRDLWNHQDLAPATGQFDSLVPPESVMLIAIGKASTSTGQ